jgi:Zn-dependent M28 family amino/carboxypeptidase
MVHKVLMGAVTAIAVLALFLAYGVVKTRLAPTTLPPAPGPGDPELPRRLLDHVRHLSATIGSRSVHEVEKLEAARDYIADGLRAAGYSPALQAVPWGGRDYANVIASIAGTTRPEETVLVGAHYDSVQGTPGADDNASAVAVLLELCQALRVTAPARTVTFVFFTLEEPPVFPSGTMGSAVYATAAAARGEQIRAMLCLEMVGYFHHRKGGQSFPLPGMGLVYPTTPDFLAVVANLKSRHLARQITTSFRASTDLPVETLATVRYLPGVDFSDHRWFWRLGYEAVMLTDTAFYRNPNYHGPGDTADTLDYTQMSKVVAGLVRAVGDLAGEP